MPMCWHRFCCRIVHYIYCGIITELVSKLLQNLRAHRGSCVLHLSALEVTLCDLICFTVISMSAFLHVYQIKYTPSLFSVFCKVNKNNRKGDKNFCFRKCLSCRFFLSSWLIFAVLASLFGTHKKWHTMVASIRSEVD